MGPQRGGPVTWRRSPRDLNAAATAIIEKKKLAGAGLAPIKPVKFRKSPREIIAAAKVIIQKKKMARCRKAPLRQALRQARLIEHLLWHVGIGQLKSMSEQQINCDKNSSLPIGRNLSTHFFVSCPSTDTSVNAASATNSATSCLSCAGACQSVELSWQTESWQDSCGAVGGLGQVDVWKIDSCGQDFTLG